jgi:hypothetical protein
MNYTRARDAPQMESRLPTYHFELMSSLFFPFPSCPALLRRRWYAIALPQSKVYDASTNFFDIINPFYLKYCLEEMNKNRKT